VGHQLRSLRRNKQFPQNYGRLQSFPGSTLGPRRFILVSQWNTATNNPYNVQQFVAKSPPLTHRTAGCCADRRTARVATRLSVNAPTQTRGVSVMPFSCRNPHIVFIGGVLLLNIAERQRSTKDLAEPPPCAESLRQRAA